MQPVVTNASPLFVLLYSLKIAEAFSPLDISVQPSESMYPLVSHSINDALELAPHVLPYLPNTAASPCAPSVVTSQFLNTYGLVLGATM